MKDGDLKQMRIALLRKDDRGGGDEIFAAVLFSFVIGYRPDGDQWPTLADGFLFLVFFLLMAGLFVWQMKVIRPRLGVFGFNTPEPGKLESALGFGKTILFALAGGAVVAVLIVLLERSGIVQTEDPGSRPFYRTSKSLFFFFIWVVMPVLMERYEWKHPVRLSVIESLKSKLASLAIGFVLVLWILGCDIFRVPNLIAIGVPTGMLLVIGVVRMVHFLKTHPRIEEGALDDLSA